MYRLASAAGIALLALAASACGTGETDREEGRGAGAGGRIVYAEPFAPRSAWALETDDAHTLMRTGCLETLVRYEADGTLVPALATDWEQVEPTVWEITLREGAEFQDGSPVDAEAVRASLNRLLEATAPARAFNPDVVTEVEAAGDATVMVSTSKPDVLLPLRLASPNTGILAEKAFMGKQVDIIGTCTGPFTVVDEVRGQSLTLERNDNYWGEKAKLTDAEVRFVADGAARASQVIADEAQLAGAIPASSRATLESEEDVTIHELQVPRTTVMLLNNSRPPFDDPLVRRAIQHALDLEAIAATIYEGGAAPAIGPFSPDDPWAPPGAEPILLDQDEAKRLLGEAGVDPGSIDIELIAYNDRPEFADLAAVIQDQLGQIGVNVKIRAGEYAGFEPDMLAGNFDAALLSRGYTVDIPDPGGFLVSDYGCDGTYNIAHYCDPETDALIDAAAVEENIDARHGAYADIADKLQAEAASIFLVHETLVEAARSNVTGIVVDPHNHYVLTPQLEAR
jgi:peptide/nickel transport system substrate-binding protein